jgi:hypothetical protein
MLQHIGHGNRNVSRERPIAGSSRRLRPTPRAYLKMEQTWLRLADSYQFSERLDLFVADKKRTRKTD